MHLRRLLPLVTIVLLAGAPPVAGATWVEAKSPNFTVYSDAGAKRARDVAWQFEQVRAALSRLWPWARFDFGAPVVVYAARDERTMRTLLPHYFEGRNAISPGSLFVSAGEAHYVALNSDQSTRGAVNVNPYISSYWSYVAMVLASTFDQDLPPWLYRGLTEVFSNTIVREREIHIGQLIPWHLERLRERSRPPLDVMLAADSRSPELTSGGDRMQRFDATAWALVHYLIFGNQGKNAPRFNEFAEALRKGAAPMDALVNAYGSLVSIREGLAVYIDQTLFVYQKANLALDVDAAGFRTREVPPAESAIALARFHAATRRPEEARAQLAAAGNPPAGGEVEGALLDRDGQREAARAAYARASDAGEATFWGEYRFAALSWPPDGEPSTDTLARMEKALRRSVSLNPTFAPSHLMLAQVLLELERYADALPVAERAETLDRRDMHAHIVMSRALWGLSKPDQAMAAAKRALSLSTTDTERRNAQQLLDFLQKSSGRPASQPGADTTVSSDEGKQLFDACNTGDNAACGKLSGMFDRACKAGDARGCMMTAFFLLEGRGVPKDEAKGMAILEPLCHGEVPEACVPIATVLLTKGDPPNRTRARELLDKSCRAGATEACDLLKTLQDQASDRSGTAAALSLRTSSADKSRHAPSGSLRSAMGPIFVRFNRSTGWPTASSIRRTWRFRPSAIVMRSTPSASRRPLFSRITCAGRVRLPSSGTPFRSFSSARSSGTPATRAS
jgi:tetratricopeptide (TPR) repeat protein